MKCNAEAVRNPALQMALPRIRKLKTSRSVYTVIDVTEESWLYVQRLNPEPADSLHQTGHRSRLSCSRPYCIRFRFRSSWGSSSSFSLSAVSVGFKMWAMLPRLVGGAELSLTDRRLSFRFAEFHDQLLKLSSPLLPLEKGGGGGVSGLEWGCEAACNEYDEKESLMRWSSGATIRLGEGGGHADGGAPSGGGPVCQPCARMSADVWRLARLPGGGSTAARG